MEDDTLTNLLNLLQNNSRSSQPNQANNTPNLNNDLQNFIIKFLLSGGLNQILNNNSTTNINENHHKPRTIDLKNYQRLD